MACVTPSALCITSTAGRGRVPCGSAAYPRRSVPSCSISTGCMPSNTRTLRNALRPWERTECPLWRNLASSRRLRPVRRAARPRVIRDNSPVVVALPDRCGHRPCSGRHAQLRCPWQEVSLDKSDGREYLRRSDQLPESLAELCRCRALARAHRGFELVLTRGCAAHSEFLPEVPASCERVDCLDRCRHGRSRY